MIKIIELRVKTIYALRRTRHTSAQTKLLDKCNKKKNMGLRANIIMQASAKVQQSTIQVWNEKKINVNLIT